MKKESETVRVGESQHRWAEMKSHAKNSKKDLRKTGNGGIIIRSFCLQNNEKEKKTRDSKTK